MEKKIGKYIIINDVLQKGIYSNWKKAHLITNKTKFYAVEIIEKSSLDN